MAIKTKVTGLDLLLKKLDKLDKNIKEDALNKILNNLGVNFVGKIKFNFNKSKTPYASGWPSLKLGGRRLKNGKIDTSAKPLLDTGKLVNSINFNVKDNILIIGTPVFYAKYHQNGEGVAKRSFLPDQGLPKNWKEDIIIKIEKVLMDLV